MSEALPVEILASNLAAVRSDIERAAARARRPASDIRLIAVSKTFPAEAVRAVAALGHADFGENKVQEALDKIDATLDLPAIRWHLIGHLQSNKVRRAAGRFALIHSVDSVELLQRLERAAAEADVRVAALVQVDLAGESTKYGTPPTALDAIYDTAGRCSHIELTGLMLLPPWSDDPEQTRPYFRRLRELGDDLARRGVPAPMLRDLSMGMSHDFAVAIEEGANIIRVGTAIFGRRTPAT